ncbi:Rrf2 family transcriptional regulator [bacterium]|nr:Rrf2 family transcriptional regulator [bacterium]
MRLTTRGHYGIRAILELAANETGPLSLKEIARRQNISLAYLEQLFNRLKRDGLVEARRGPGGGYVLGRRPSGITVGEVYRSLEGEIVFARCRESDGAEDCAGAGDCVSRLLWEGLGRRVREYLDSLTLADLLAAARERREPIASPGRS